MEGKKESSELESPVNIEGSMSMSGKVTDTLSIPAIAINYILELFFPFS